MKPEVAALMKLGVPGRVPKNCSTGPIILIVGLSKGCDTWEGWPESVKESAERESSRRGTGDLHPQSEYSHLLWHLFLPYSLAMSPTDNSSSYFQSAFDTALSDYAKETGVDLTTHPFAHTLENCDSADRILDILEEKAQQFRAYRDGNRKLIDCIKPIFKCFVPSLVFLARPP